MEKQYKKVYNFIGTPWSFTMLMTNEKRDLLATIITAPYMALATIAICLARQTTGNQFRHMAQTRDILIDYGHIDAVLHKAALVHDLIEDIPGINHDLIINADEDGKEVYELVLEVSRRPGESKPAFLERIFSEGSEKACLIKAADRIDNLHDIGFTTDRKFISRYCDESEKYVLPISDRVDRDMSTEIRDLIVSRRELLTVLVKQFDEKGAHSSSPVFEWT
jgi:GTP pyrophosphokinase